MKIDKYAVSVQWGEGFHYFLNYFATPEAATYAAKTHENYLKARQGKRGAKPKTYIWKLVQA